MDITSLTYLDLRCPLSYAKVDNITDESALFSKINANTGENDDYLLCYNLNPAQSSSIEPECDQFLCSLVFIGRKTRQEEENEVVLPAGNYLFNQCRADIFMNKEEWLDIAVEQQKDGLWERRKPGNLLFIRYLREDGAFVTQVFRPVTED